MAKLIQSEHTPLISPRMPSLVKSPLPPFVKGGSVKRRGFALSMAVLAYLLIIPTLALAHGGMGPDEIGPPIMTSGLIGFACYWLVMLWPSSRKGNTAVRSETPNQFTQPIRKRSRKHSAHGKRGPRLRKIEGNGQFDSDQTSRRRANNG